MDAVDVSGADVRRAKENEGGIDGRMARGTNCLFIQTSQQLIRYSADTLL